MFSFFYKRSIRLILEIEKLLWKSELCYFWPLILKQPKGQKYFYGHFHSSLALLINTKLRCLQKKNIGHTRVARVLLSYYLYCDSRPIEFQNQARDYNFVKMKIDMLKKIGNFFLPKFDRKLPKTSSKQTNNMVLANPGSFWNNLDEYGIFNVVRL